MKSLLRLLARLTLKEGEACVLLPKVNIDLPGYGESVIDLDTQDERTVLSQNLGVAQEQLDRARVTGAAIDERRLGPAQRVGSKETPILIRCLRSILNQPRILAGCLGTDHGCGGLRIETGRASCWQPLMYSSTASRVFSVS